MTEVEILNASWILCGTALEDSVNLATLNLPMPGFAFSFFAIVSSLILGLTSDSAESAISTSSFSFDALELGAPLLVLLEEKESFDCFAGGFGALGFPKNLLF